MKETQLLSSLFPAHPDILPILEEIRETCKIPEISPTQTGIFVSNK